MVKCERLAAVLRQRLAAGDYALRPFPSERDLAVELGASYLTARKAVLQLIAEGALVRSGRGRAMPAPAGSSGRPTVAMLAPGWPSRGILRTHQLLEAAAQAHGQGCRSLRYFHWDDAVVADALNRSVGTLIVMPAVALTDEVVAGLREARARVVVVGQDLSHHGIRCIDHLPAVGVRLALDHLVEQGARRVAVLNVQPDDHSIRSRLAEARVWARAHPGIAFEEWNRPVPAGEDPLPMARAVAGQLLADGDGLSAVLGITLPGAMGALRAAADRGLRRPLVAAMDGEEMAVDLLPSITSVDGAGLPEAVAAAVRWMAGGDWSGPLLIRCRPEIAIRESSRP